MLSEDKYFKTLTEAELWQRYCGFLDLSIDEFMEIQNDLLMDEIERVADSTLGKKIMGENKPGTVEEFRQRVPLTNYDDYEPYLSERQENALAIVPHTWCHSAGRGGRFKWLPFTTEFLDRVTRSALATFILSTARQKDQINISPGTRLLLTLAPPPYASGYTIKYLSEHFSYRAFPDPEETRDLPFPEKIKKGFQMALKEEVDIIGSLASVLVKMGEEFVEPTEKRKLTLSMLHPKIIFRMLGAQLRSKREKRGILPKDLWHAKAIMTGGMDTAIYRDTIAYYWGNMPYQFYICVEAFYLAMQGWNKKEMTFVPDHAFLEFIPIEEIPKINEDKDYQPRTVLLNGVEEGKLYEVVITQFYGMPLLRYRMKDIVKFVALKDTETGVNLPQMVFQRRVDEAINLAGLAQLDEKTIWQAIANTGMKYTEWTACKEYDGDKSFLRIFLELKETREPAELEKMIDEQLKIVDTDYSDINAYLEFQPVRVTLVSPGTFQRYMDEKRKEGANPSHFKPIHVNPTAEAIQLLLKLSEVGEAR